MAIGGMKRTSVTWPNSSRSTATSILRLTPFPIPRVFEPLGYQRFLEAPAEYVEALPPERLSSVRTRHTTVLHTPKGDLQHVYDEDDGIFTTWDIRRPIETLEDVDRLLSVPYRFTPPASEEFEPFRRTAPEPEVRPWAARA